VCVFVLVRRACALITALKAIREIAIRGATTRRTGLDERQFGRDAEEAERLRGLRQGARPGGSEGRKAGGEERRRRERGEGEGGQEGERKGEYRGKGEGARERGSEGEGDRGGGGKRYKYWFTKYWFTKYWSQQEPRKTGGDTKR